MKRWSHPLFQGMEFSDDPDQLAEWMPLMMDGRTVTQPIAATRMKSGTDVNFGALTRMLFQYLQKENVEIRYRHHVESIKRTSDNGWEMTYVISKAEVC